MKRFTYLALTIVFLIGIAITFDACKKEDEKNETLETPTLPGINEYVLNENVVVLDSTLVPIIDGNKYTFDFETEPPEIEVGDIIIGYSDGGYIKEVLSIEETNKSTDGNLILVLGEALFDLVFKYCNFDIDVPLYSYEKPLDDIELLSEEVEGVNLDVSIEEGDIAIDLMMNFKLQRINGETILFSLTAEGDIDFYAQAQFTASGEIEYEKEKLLVTPHLLPFSIGPVPALVVLKLNGGFNTYLSAEGTIGYSCVANAEAEFGAKYTNENEWEIVWDPDPTFTNSYVYWGFTLESSAEVYIKPEFNLLIAGVAGPLINARPFLNLETNVDYHNWMWAFSGGLRGDLGFVLSAFGFYDVVDLNLTLAEWDAVIDSDQGINNHSPETPTNPIPGNQFDEISNTILLQWDCKDPDNDLLTFEIYFSDSNPPTMAETNYNDFSYAPGSLSQYTQYYWKIIAKDDKGNQTEGPVWEFITGNSGSTFTDSRDGHTYNTVTLGLQTWFAENLNYEMENSWCYWNEPPNCEKYGRLYDWWSALEACPDGWHLPSDEEWKILKGRVDSQYDAGDPEWNELGVRGYDAGDNLKTTSGWTNNHSSTDMYGFSGLPGGSRTVTGTFTAIGGYGYFWTSTEKAPGTSFSHGLSHLESGTSHGYLGKSRGNSIRCIKDE